MQPQPEKAWHIFDLPTVLGELGARHSGLSSETKSAFALSPFRSPTLLYGAIGAFLAHVAALYILFVQDVLETEPVSVATWITLVPLAVLIVPAIEFHKWAWKVQKRAG